MEELADEAAEQSGEADAWTKALEHIAARAAAEKEKEQTGRGVRRKAAAVFSQVPYVTPAVPKSHTDSLYSKASIWAIPQPRGRARARGGGSRRVKQQAPTTLTSMLRYRTQLQTQTEPLIMPWMWTISTCHQCPASALLHQPVRCRH